MNKNTDLELKLENGTYFGQLKKGLPYGYGTISYNNGDHYEGTFLKGKKDGQGLFTWTYGKTMKVNLKWFYER